MKKLLKFRVNYTLIVLDITEASFFFPHVPQQIRIHSNSSIGSDLLVFEIQNGP